MTVTTPRARLEAESRRQATAGVVSRCVDLLEGRDVDEAFVLMLGGEHGANVLAGSEGGKHGYWPRVWAARGLLHVWDASATTAVIAATADSSWRVREMSARVIAHHRVGDAINAVAALRTDPVERVRDAAERAVRVLAGARA
jgi:hypothetical protein